MILIDGNSLLNRAYYAMSVFSTKDGLPSNGIFGFGKLVFKIIEDEKHDYFVVAYTRQRSAIKCIRITKRRENPCRRSSPNRSPF